MQRKHNHIRDMQIIVKKFRFYRLTELSNIPHDLNVNIMLFLLIKESQQRRFNENANVKNIE